MKAILLVTVLVLAGCNNVKDVELTCTAASGALKSLTIANNQHPLPKKLQLDVSTAGDVVATTCAAKVPQTATQQFQNAAGIIVSDWMSYQQGAH